MSLFPSFFYTISPFLHLLVLHVPKFSMSIRIISSSGLCLHDVCSKFPFLWCVEQMISEISDCWTLCSCFKPCMRRQNYIKDSSVVPDTASISYKVVWSEEVLWSRRSRFCLFIRLAQKICSLRSHFCMQWFFFFENHTFQVHLYFNGFRAFLSASLS